MKLTTSLSSLVLLAAVLGSAPLAAAGDGDDERRTVRAVRVLDCDDGDDCPQIIHLGHQGGYLGVELTRLSPELRAHFGAAEDAGVLISTVTAESPAARAGLRVGDVITAIDGEPVRSTGQLSRLIRGKAAEAPVDIEVIRDRRAQVMRAIIERRARTTVDLGGLFDIEGLDELHKLGPMIGATVAGTLESLDLEGLGKHLEGMNLEGLGAIGLHFDEAGLEEAFGAIDKTFSSDAWKAWSAKLESMDWSQLEERMQALQERMKELERELEARHRDD